MIPEFQNPNLNPEIQSPNLNPEIQSPILSSDFLVPVINWFALETLNLSLVLPQLYYLLTISIYTEFSSSLIYGINS